MKKDKLIYWISTGIVSAMMFLSSFMYLSQNPELMNGFKMLGYPVYFIQLLGIAKFLGAVALIIPAWEKIKEWAYAGFTFTFIGAIWTHISTGTPFIMPLIVLIVLLVSYWFRDRINGQNFPAAQ